MHLMPLYTLLFARRPHVCFSSRLLPALSVSFRQLDAFLAILHSRWLFLALPVIRHCRCNSASTWSLNTLLNVQCPQPPDYIPLYWLLGSLKVVFCPPGRFSTSRLSVASWPLSDLWSLSVLLATLFSWLPGKFRPLAHSRSSEPSWLSKPPGRSQSPRRLDAFLDTMQNIDCLMSSSQICFPKLLLNIVSVNANRRFLDIRISTWNRLPSIYEYQWISAQSCLVFLGR